MKYVIWGAGRRGKWTNHFVGAENVAAFIDGNEQRLGHEFCGKKIITFEEAEKKYEDCLIIITPLQGGDNIEQQLKQQGFYKYVKLDELPMYIPCDEQDEFSIVSLYDKNRSYGLIGINIFTIYLYEKMKQTKTTVHMAIYGEVHSDLINLLKEHIEFSSVDEIIKTSDEVIVLNKKDKELAAQKSITADDFTIKNLLPVKQELLKFKDIHKGKRCFIVATGPSLRVQDLDKLHENGEICISMNRIFNIFDKTQWRPDYYMIGDMEMIEDLSEQIADLKLPYKFVATEPKSYWKNPKSKGSIPYKLLLRGYIHNTPQFSANVERGVCHGTNITYLCIQLAVYMGFSKIYLLGVDFNYTPNVYDAANHFEGCDTPQNRIRLNPIYPEKVQLSYEVAKQYCNREQIHVYNATRGGKLEVYDRVDFDTLF